MKYILASASPRRKELLRKTGISFEIMPSSKEEVITEELPADVVTELAYQKAADIFSLYHKIHIKMKYLANLPMNRKHWICFLCSPTVPTRSTQVFHF